MAKAKVVIAGGTGFIGKAVRVRLQELGFESVVLSRTPGPGRAVWDAKTLGEWTSEIDSAECVINLSGRPIVERWTPDSQVEMTRSRVETTRLLGEAILRSKSPPKVWVNASGIGFYGNRGDKKLTESSSAGTGFIAELAKKWEDAVHESETPSTRKVILRISGVLGREGGMLPPLVTLTRCFLGSAVGTGRQWVSWIHIEDLVGLTLWAMESNVIGTINACAPNPVTNRQLMAALRQAYGRPWVPNVPEFVFRLVAGLRELEPTLILDSQRAYPELALALGFRFKFENLTEAIKDLCE